MSFSRILLYTILFDVPHTVHSLVSSSISLGINSFSNCSLLYFWSFILEVSCANSEKIWLILVEASFALKLFAQHSIYEIIIDNSIPNLFINQLLKFTFACSNISDYYN